MQKKIFVISGPSGVGKTTIVQALLCLEISLKQTRSFTTRKPRSNERNGQDYFFVDQEEFQREIQSGNFVEWECIYGHFYGTHKRELEQIFSEGKWPLLVIDVKGAKTVSANFPSVLIFLEPPSWQILETRLRSRGEESEQEIEQRLARAKEELKEKQSFHYCVFCNDVDSSCKVVQKIVSIETISSM